MIKTILEKEKTTLVHQPTQGPLLLVAVAIVAVTAMVLLRNTLEVQQQLLIALLPVAALGGAALWFRRKSILVIDQAKHEIEEYLGNERRLFEFAHVGYADVARVREEEEASAPATEETTAVAVHKPRPHLNYHPYLQLKSPAEVYYLFDHGGRGMTRYREARTLVEAINTSLSLSKEDRKALNVYQMRTKGDTPVVYPAIILVLLLVIGGLVLKLYGYL